MPKTALEQWDETNANNSDIGGTNIAENCLPSGINNAIREEMAQVAAWLGDDTLASAATTDLGSVPGRYVSVTGTTTITAFGTIKAGTIKYVKFAGALTLTHNGTSLILLGAANITTAAGDTAIFVSEGSGNWRCFAYHKAALPPEGSVVQIAYDSETAYTTCATVIPYDDTLPQSTEGNEVLSVAITPAKGTSWLMVEVALMVGSNTAGGDVTAAVFRDASANASFAGTTRVPAVGAMVPLVFRQILLANTATAQTLTVRVGGNTGQTAYLNGASTGRIGGGGASSTITITEFKA